MIGDAEGLPGQSVAVAAVVLASRYGLSVSDSRAVLRASAAASACTDTEAARRWLRPFVPPAADEAIPPHDPS